MRIALYGGSFNPPHQGHRAAAETALRELRADKFLIIPDNIPPHKDMAEGSPSAEERIELCRLNFAGMTDAEVSDMELMRSGKSYTSRTVEVLRDKYPGDELVLIVGTDMFLSFKEWRRFEYLLENCTLAVIRRENDDEKAISDMKRELGDDFGAKVILLPHVPMPMSSSEIRKLLRKRKGRELLSDAVYSRIIKKRLYSASPDMNWLREKAYAYLKPSRTAHVAGCEKEAVRLAQKWGEDPDTAAEAGILHDITKRLSYDEQLILCSKYGIILDNTERESPALLHAVTGAPFARELFGIPDNVYSAIRWHTTGRPDMSLLEKIVYLADIIEPGRDFPGVETLRKLSYENIDKAMAAALKGSMEEVRSHGRIPHKNSAAAYEWYAAES